MKLHHLRLLICLTAVLSGILTQPLLGMGTIKRIYRKTVNSPITYFTFGTAASAGILYWQYVHKMRKINMTDTELMHRLGNNAWDHIIRYALVMGGSIYSLDKALNMLWQKALTFAEKKDKLTFKDVVGGVPPLLLEAADKINHIKEYEKFGSPMSRGILLYGPPGTGKTYLAKALAGECNAQFLETKGSDFGSKYIHEASQKIEAFFDKLEKEAAESGKPVVGFIDEADAIGTRQEGETHSTAQERNSTITTLLARLEGFKKRKDVFIVLATNLPNALDKAVISRLSACIEVPPFTLEQRMELIKKLLTQCKHNSIDISAYERPANQPVDYASDNDQPNRVEQDNKQPNSIDKVEAQAGNTSRVKSLLLGLRAHCPSFTTWPSRISQAISSYYYPQTQPVSFNYEMIKSLAEQTNGFSNRDIDNMFESAKQAAINNARTEKKYPPAIKPEHIDFAHKTVQDLCTRVGTKDKQLNSTQEEMLRHNGQLLSTLTSLVEQLRNNPNFQAQNNSSVNNNASPIPSSTSLQPLNLTTNLNPLQLQTINT